MTEDSRNVVAFLEARLSEDEAAAKAATSWMRFKARPNDWTRLMCDPILGPFGGQTARRDIATGLYVGKMSDPARVLRDLAAKRALMAGHEETPECQEACPLLRKIAAVYSDHPDYDPGWRP